MKDDRQRLINQVSKFTNGELLQLLEGNLLDYRVETIIYAKAEANKRGLSYSPVVLSTPCHQTNKAIISTLMVLLRSSLIPVCSGTVLGILILINYLINASMLSSSCVDCAIEYGFPFAWYVTGGFGTGPGIIWTGMILNIAMALSIGFSMGWFCKKKWGTTKKTT